MEKEIFNVDEYAGADNKYCISLSNTAELIENSDEDFNTDNSGDLLVEVEYPELTVEKISEFLDDNSREYSNEDKEKAISIIEELVESDYERGDTSELVELLDRVLRKEARKELIKEAAKLGIGVQDIRFSSYPLERERRAKGLTQAQLAELSDVSQQNISEYESGKRNLLTARADTLLKLATVLDCRIDDII